MLRSELWAQPRVTSGLMAGPFLTAPFYRCVKHNTELTWILCEEGASSTLRVTQSKVDRRGVLLSQLVTPEPLASHVMLGMEVSLLI